MPTWNTCFPSAIFVFLLQTPLEMSCLWESAGSLFHKGPKIRDPSRPNAKNTTGTQKLLDLLIFNISVPTCPHHCSALTGLSCSKIDFTGSVAVTRTSQGPCSFLSVSDIEMHSQTLPFTFFLLVTCQQKGLRRKRFCFCQRCLGVRALT